MVALHGLCWNPLIFLPDDSYRKNTWLRTMCCLQVNLNPLHTSPFWLNIVLDVSKLTIIQHTHTTQLYFADRNYLWPFHLFSQSQQSLTKCNLFCFVLQVRNCHLISLIVLVLQWMLKWSKRVSLRSVSFTNYPTLHYPLLSTFLFFLFLFFFIHVYKFYTSLNITIYQGNKIKCTQNFS